jgi:hypothetical protein
MEEAAVKALAIVDGAAQFAVDAEKEQTEKLLPAEIRYKRAVLDDKVNLTYSGKSSMDSMLKIIHPPEFRWHG